MELKKIFVTLLFATALASLSSAQPVVFTVLNAASYNAAISPGALVSIFGVNLATAPLTAPSGSPAPSLGGTSVQLGNTAATLLYVSPTQINALLPSDATGSLVVTSAAGISTAYNLRLTREAPGIFTQAGGALLFDGNFNPLTSINPGQNVILYATGLGPVDNSGHVVDPVDVYLGERKAQVSYAGIAPGIPGVYQLNVVVPRLASDRLFVRSGGWQSNIVYLYLYDEDLGSVPMFQPGNNTANAKGSIDGLYPSADPSYPKVRCSGEGTPINCGFESVSIMLHAGTYTVSFDIVPSATPFDVAAVSDAGSALITIEPAAHTYTASVTTLTDRQRAGDLSQSVVPLWDYASCDQNANCFAFPGPSLIPASRMNPWWLQAVRALPQPNAADAMSPNAVFTASGTFSGSHFTIDDQNNSTLSKFGGIEQLPLGPFESGNSTFKLYVDQHVVAAKTIHYVPAQRCFVTGPICWGAGTMPE